MLPFINQNDAVLDDFFLFFNLILLKKFNYPPPPKKKKKKLREVRNDVVKDDALRTSSAQSQPQPDPTPDPFPLSLLPLVVGAQVHFTNQEHAIEVFVDGCSVKVPKGMMVLQACKIASVDIP